MYVLDIHECVSVSVSVCLTLTHAQSTHTHSVCFVCVCVCVCMLCDIPSPYANVCLHVCIVCAGMCAYVWCVHMCAVFACMCLLRCAYVCVCIVCANLCCVQRSTCACNNNAHSVGQKTLADPKYINNQQEVRLRSFSTKVHKIDAMVAYKADD